MNWFRRALLESWAMLMLTVIVAFLGPFGSYLAGLALGLFTAFFGALVSPAYTTAAAFLVLIAVLVARPGGLSAAPGAR